jgi:hypothetical protein
VWLPTANADGWNVAWPVPSSVTGGCGAPSRVNVTVPVGTPLPGGTGVTVAVNVTAWPNTEGVADAVTAVVVPAPFTVCDTVDDVLGPKCPSPGYSAVSVRVPTARADVVNVATPRALRVAVPSSVVPSLNVTVPVGVAGSGVAGDTVAVSVTVSPTVEGFGVDPNVVTDAVAATVNVKACVTAGPLPELAVIVSGYSPAVPAAGVPASVAVPSPSSVNVTPVGSVPVTVSVTGGAPRVVTVKLPSVPTENVVAFALVIVRPVWLGPPTSAPPVNEGGRGKKLATSAPVTPSKTRTCGPPRGRPR